MWVSAWAKKKRQASAELCGKCPICATYRRGVAIGVAPNHALTGTMRMVGVLKTMFYTLSRGGRVLYRENFKAKVYNRRAPQKADLPSKRSVNKPIHGPLNRCRGLSLGGGGGGRVETQKEGFGRVLGVSLWGM